MKALCALLVLVMLWGVGLFAFAARVAHSTPAADPGKAQGIVALTGPSPTRMTAGISLLQEGHGQRLLISGVNRMNSRDDIRRAARAVAGPTYDCCVDLGFEAVDTIGNAREAADWARARDYDQLIVVTADYHMPRALLELRGALPHAQLTAYPVVTSEVNARAWWRNQHETRRMTLEYTKYLVILGREAILGLGPKA
jgi:uncharacterized SAM-binding protein YcdF (DUF218 family)